MVEGGIREGGMAAFEEDEALGLEVVIDLG